jgi:hypothetical protein
VRPKPCSYAATTRTFISNWREADNRLLGGRILANLSHQANCLGQHGMAINLTRAKSMGANGAAMALFSTMETRALATQGTRPDALAPSERSSAGSSGAIVAWRLPGTCHPSCPSGAVTLALNQSSAATTTSKTAVLASCVFLMEG